MLDQTSFDSSALVETNIKRNNILKLHTFICVDSGMLECVRNAMATNLAIDDNLIDEARQIGGHTTKKEAVTAALQEYVARRKQLEILKLFGTIEFDESYNIRRNRDLDRIEGDL